METTALSLFQRKGAHGLLKTSTENIEQHSVHHLASGLRQYSTCAIHAQWGQSPRCGPQNKLKHYSACCSTSPPMTCWPVGLLTTTEVAATSPERGNGRNLLMGTLVSPM